MNWLLTASILVLIQIVHQLSAIENLKPVLTSIAKAESCQPWKNVKILMNWLIRGASRNKVTGASYQTIITGL